MTDLFTGLDHDGETYDRPRDQVRLNAQQQRVFDVMKDGKWRTIIAIGYVTRDPQASISARLRDLRKPKFGGHIVERKYIADGLWQYRMIVNDG